MCTKRMSSILLAFTVQISIVARAGDRALSWNALMDAGMVNVFTDPGTAK